jgi:plastocyanin
VQLQVFARDQRGKLMPSVVGLTFSSSDPAIATVTSSGFVKGVAGGTADISVATTVEGVTRSAAMKATILAATPLANVVLTADLKRGWQPSVAHLTVGGTVQWVTAGPLSWSEVPHRMLYLLDTMYSVVDSLDLSAGSATREFPTAGEYRYCSAGCWDPPDFGVVYVH